MAQQGKIGGCAWQRRQITFSPDLVVEVLSQGSTNQRRDYEAKLKLISRRGVLEYWIVDWLGQSIEVYRRQNTHLELCATLRKGDLLESPLLLSFSEQVDAFFEGVS